MPKAKKKPTRKAIKKKPAKKPRKSKAAVDELWPADKIERRPIAELVPYARNSNKHPPDQVEAIAEAIRFFGWTVPALIDEDGLLLAGHGRVLAAEKIGLQEVPVVVASGWSEAKKRAYVIADNQLARRSELDADLLRLEIEELARLDFDLDILGFEQGAFDDWLNPPDGSAEATAAELEEADKTIGQVEAVVVSEQGDLWLLGEHRVLCGDSTNRADLAELMGDNLADLVHADPPYGMGKEADGVANDNQYGDKLDAFQLDWLAAAFTHARDNCGLYIWGNAPDLWRLWWRGGLAEFDQLLVRNEIVWSKGSGFGMASEGQHSYSPSTERCLFVMRGPQFIGNQNKEDYWQGYEPLRLWMIEQRDAEGWSNKHVNEITSSHMAGHWFSQSQFHPISRHQYEKLAAAAERGGFALSYDDLVARFSEVKAGGNAHRREISAALREDRTYFDNAHEAMTDVWTFGRVVGGERFGHATPKPVKMIARAIKTSTPDGGLVLEPFLGTGSTLIAAEILERRCFGLELEPAYVDIIVRRWQRQTGKAATLASSGATFEAVAHERDQ